MATYHYEGLSADGTPIQGTLEAANRREATEKARQRCRVLQNVEAMHSADINRLLHMDMGMLLSGGRIPGQKLALLCARLSIQLRAGFPLVRALRLTAQTEQNQYLREILDKTADDVHSGDSLSQAFRRRCPGLPDIFSETLRAGEASGTLEASFDRLRSYFEDSAALSQRVGAAMIYPAMLLVTAVAVILVILIYAVPVFQKSFAAMGESLPLPTQILIAISTFLTKHFPALLAAMAMALMGLVLLAKSPGGRRAWDAALLRLPGIGNVVKMRAAARFSMTLATLLAAGLPLAQAAGITAGTEENLRIREDLERACARIPAGRSLSSGMKQSRNLPLLLTEMTALGEETGSLEQTLTVVSAYFSREAENAVKRMLAFLEPCITCVLAVLVIFILLCVYLPVFGMYGGI